MYKVEKSPTCANLRVRKIATQQVIQRAIDSAQKQGLCVIRASHGGSVPNSYAYPAKTEGLVVVAWPDGRYWARLDTLPANKVTLSGVFFKLTGYRGLFDNRFGDVKKNEVRKQFIASIHADAPEHDGDR